MNINRDSVLRQALTGAVAVAASVGLALPAAAMPADGFGPTEAPTGDCSIEQIREDIDVAEMDMVMFCDGDWAQVGKYQTDYILNAYFNGETWVVPPYDGQVTEGLMHGCYTEEHIDALGGAPEEAGIPICDPAITTYY